MDERKSMKVSPGAKAALIDIKSKYKLPSETAAIAYLAALESLLGDKITIAQQEEVKRLAELISNQYII